MLLSILESAGLNPKNCADLLGLDHKLFCAWVKGEKPVPGFIVAELSSVLGVPHEQITSSSQASRRESADAPSIWFKFRSGGKLTDADREIVMVIRKLGYFMDQLEQIARVRAISWKSVFDTIRREVTKQASPKEQGRQAAGLLRSIRQFGFPNTGLSTFKGVGDILRDNLRATGIRIVETPVQVSHLEGCCFYVGSPGDEKPCLFANTYKQTWFRRNMVLAHELAHAIFDIETAAASIDFIDEFDRSQQLEEARAEAFAQEALVPQELLHHIAQTKGLKWGSLTTHGLALLVAYAQVEQRAVVKAAFEAGFIDEQQAEQYRSMHIHDDLKQLTERALSTREFVESRKLESREIISAENRTTTIPSRALRLPLPYVAKVVELTRKEAISPGKAAQFLMIDREVLEQRFGACLNEVPA